MTRKVYVEKKMILKMVDVNADSVTLEKECNKANLYFTQKDNNIYISEHEDCLVFHNIEELENVHDYCIWFETYNERKEEYEHHCFDDIEMTCTFEEIENELYENSYCDSAIIDEMDVDGQAEQIQQYCYLFDPETCKHFEVCELKEETLSNYDDFVSDYLDEDNYDLYDDFTSDEIESLESCFDKPHSDITSLIKIYKKVLIDAFEIKYQKELAEYRNSNKLEYAFLRKDAKTLDKILQEIQEEHKEELLKELEEKQMLFVIHSYSKSGWDVQCFDNAEYMLKWFDIVNEPDTLELIVSINKCVHDSYECRWYAYTEPEYQQVFYKFHKPRGLAELRNIKGLSQSKLASLANVSVRMIQKYEQGEKDINQAAGITLYKLAKALNCNIEELLNLK